MENVLLNLLLLFLSFLNIFSTDFIQSEKPFSIDCINIYLFSVFFSIDFARWKREPLVSECKSLTTKLLALNPATCTYYPASYASLLPCIVYILLTLQRVSIVKPFCVLLPHCVVLTPHLDNFPKNPKNDEIMLIWYNFSEWLLPKNILCHSTVSIVITKAAAQRCS